MDSGSIPQSSGFRGILWPAAQADEARDDAAEPDCFHDLNLDQVFAETVSAWPEENLTPFFRIPMHDVAGIGYRQAVFRDLERAPLKDALTTFVESMRAMRAHRDGIEKLYYPREKKRALLAAADLYCAAVTELKDALERLQPVAAALRDLDGYLRNYTASEAFRSLDRDRTELLAALGAIRYDLLIRTGSVTVRACEDQANASRDVAETFARFRRDAGKDYRTHHHGRIGVASLNHVEAQVLDKVALLNPQPFAALDAFCAAHQDFVDAAVARCAREICFYLAWLAYTGPMRAAGLPFCQPAVSASKAVEATDTFDIALAARQTRAHQPVVSNRFALAGAERMLVVSGPNHGGKTTFARTFGQLHWLAMLGCSVPGSHARLFLADALFTHFEKQEDIATLRGKLQDDLVRMHGILEQATPRSIVILNEIFASTTLEDALDLGRRIMQRISRLDALAVCVTFLTELASFNEKTVSMVAEVDPADPAIRTFAVTRRPADGLAYALAIAKKYRVTREWLLRRIAP